MSAGLRPVGDNIWAVAAGTFPANSYICGLEGADEAILIDANLDAAALEASAEAVGRRIVAVFCTHGHFDHIGSAAHFQQRGAAPVYLHRADERMARTNNFLLMAIGRSERIEVPDLTLVDDGDVVEIGGLQVRFRHAPGHTPGSCVIEIGEHLFTGDTIYSRGVGLSKLPGEKHDQLRETILGLLPDLHRFQVHPGHGPSSPGAEILNHNSPLRAFLDSDPSSTSVWDGSDV